MSQIYGTIINVSTVNVGEPVTIDAVSGSTTIAVANAATFDELGGLLTLNGVQYAYTAIDTDLNTITLLTGLVVAASEGDRVEVLPLAPIKRALIDIGDEDGEALPVTVPHAIAAVLPDGMREDAERESVLLEQRAVGQLYLRDVIAAAPEVAPARLLARITNSGTLAPTTTTPTLVPGTSANLLFAADIDYEYTLSVDVTRSGALNQPIRIGVFLDGTQVADSMNIVLFQGTNLSSPGRIVTSVTDYIAATSEGGHLVEVRAYQDAAAAASWQVNAVRLLIKRL